MSYHTIITSFVFFGIVLHDFDEPSKVLTNAAKTLKPSGKLVNLDWKKEPMKFGPPVHIRFTEEKAIKLIEAGGFKVKIVKNFGLYHYLIIARIRPDPCPCKWARNHY